MCHTLISPLSVSRRICLTSFQISFSLLISLADVSPETEFRTRVAARNVVGKPHSCNVRWADASMGGNNRICHASPPAYGSKRKGRSLVVRTICRAVRPITKIIQTYPSLSRGKFLLKEVILDFSLFLPFSQKP